MPRRDALLARLRSEPVVNVGRWTRDELYRLVPESVFRPVWPEPEVWRRNGTAPPRVPVPGRVRGDVG